MTEEEKTQINEVSGIGEFNRKVNKILEEKSNFVFYFIVSIFIIIVSILIEIYIGLSNGQIFFTTMVLILILVLLYQYQKKVAEKKEAKVVGMKEGWLVTWADKWKHYMKAPKESTLLLVYGRYVVYSNGQVVSLPDTFRLTWYKTDYTPILFNPYIRSEWILYKAIEEEYGEIVWADGTDRYWSAMERDLSTIKVEA